MLTPGEADEVLGMLRDMVGERRSHHPDDHPQIPRGHGVRRRSDDPAARQARRGTGKVKDLTPDAMARTMIGAEELTVQPAADRRVRRAAARHREAECARRCAASRRCATSRLSIRGGEIVGVAGVSGNGQRQLVEVLAGQREAESGEI